MYHYIVDKYHVATSDRALLRAIIRTRTAYARTRGSRYTKFRAWVATHARDGRHAFLRACLAAHHENQALYRAVIQGGV